MAVKHSPSHKTNLQPTLSSVDAVALIVGMVVGVGIFETPALVAANSASITAAMMAWFLGGIISLLGALCYAELATTYPHAGGTYYYLQRAFGSRLSFLFAWSRMTVVQTGSIALLAFVLGDYASQVWRWGEFSSAIYASIAIALLTGVNIIGIYQGKLMQNFLTAAKVLGILLAVLGGLFFTATPSTVVTTNAGSSGGFGLAMVFVLLTYGGWNEAAYLSADVRDSRRSMTRVLLVSILAITLIYLLINWAYLHGLGLAAISQSDAPAADLMRGGFGEGGARFISALIAVSALGAANATIFTGARSNYALGQDFPRFAWLAKWHGTHNTPINALLFQGVVAILLVILGAFTRNGFETMVNYTAPVFWFFFLLSGIALFRLRHCEPDLIRPFRVPLYPIIPLLFCATCSYLLYSSVNYAGAGTILGILVLLTGIPLFFLSR